MGLLDDLQDPNRKYKDLTLETLKEAMRDFYEGRKIVPKGRLDWDIGPIYDVEKIRHLKSVYGMFIDQLGVPIYHLGGGVISGKGGWDMFIKALKERGEEMWTELDRLDKIIQKDNNEATT